MMGRRKTMTTRYMTSLRPTAATLSLEHFGLSSLQQLNEIDPTLQRSNPRQKAEQYRKERPEVKEKAEDTTDTNDMPEADAKIASETAEQSGESAQD
jgi:phosphoenolpyruvate carboxylase